MVAIGIDLGTTNSCVSIYRNGEVEIITNDQGKNVTPSYVCFSETYGRLVGDEAKNKAIFEPKNTVFDAKRLIGRKFDDPQVQNDMKLWPFEVVNEGTIPKIMVTSKGKQRSYYPEEISSIILEKLKETAEKYLKTSVKNCVITVPAYFNDSQRQATIDAGNIAGLNVMKIINEPTAAAIAYGFNNKSDKEQIVLVFDLGGGTFDVSILKIKGFNMTVLSTGGDTHLGGEDFDNQIMEYVIKEFEKKHEVNIKSDVKAIRRIRSACEKAKIQLTSGTHTDIEIMSLLTPDDDSVVPDGSDLSNELTRDKFDELNAELFESTIDTIKECLTSAKLKVSDIDEIVLVGGSSRIPRIRNIVQNFFKGKELNKSIHPDEAVARGAAIRAAMLDGDTTKEFQNCSLQDITPMSMGIEVIHGEMSIIIPKNSRIPIEKTEKYTTSEDYQAIVAISVGEGDNIRFKDNNFLGEFVVSDLPPKKAGKVELNVTFKLDDNGILSVNCIETSKKSSNQITIQHNKGRLTDKQIEHIKNESQEAKKENESRNKISEIKNKIYDFCFDMEQDLKNKYNNWSEIPEVTDVIDKCEEVVEWVDDHNTTIILDYENKYHEIESYCNDTLQKI